MARGNDLVGYEVRSTDDDRLGTVTSVWFDERTRTPAIVAVLLGSGEARLVPMRDSVVDGARRLVRVPYREDIIRAAPPPTSSDVARDEAARLSRHFGIGVVHEREASRSTAHGPLGDEFERA